MARSSNHTHWILLFVLVCICPAQANAGWQFTGRFAFSNSTSSASAGDLGYTDTDEHLTYSDQQTVRLMQDAYFGAHELTAHYRMVRLHSSSLSQSPAIFRYTPLDHHFLHDPDSLDWKQEIDYLGWRGNFGKYRLSLGRQAISLSNSRVWQPLDVFGSFDTLELDREYKPGIDAASISWYPADFSEISFYTVLSNRELEYDNYNFALRAQHQLGSGSLAIVQVARLIDLSIFGFAVETLFLEQAVRLEGIYTLINDTDRSLFATLGTERTFDEGSMVMLELYFNSLGSWETSGFREESRIERQLGGLQNHLGKYLGAMAFSDQITPLMSASYMMLLSPADDQGATRLSWLHQLAVNYSLGNETDIQFALVSGYGKGLENEKPASEFGHIPFNASIRIHSYF